MQIATMLLQIFGGLAIFMYGMELTSDGIQRAAGERFQNALNFMTKNRVMAVLSGAVVTVVVQSSSATSVMVINFVNAGLLSLTQGIGVIMGANIGTTLTGWIIAAVGVAQFSISSLAVPIFGLGFFMSIWKKRSDSFRSYGKAFMGIACIFLGLSFIQNSIPKPSPDMLMILQDFSSRGFIAVLVAVLVGAVFTMLINASSATIAIVIAMASQGIIDFRMAGALVLGANIGTTMDAFIASLSPSAGTNARRTAWAHILFNVIGTVWVLILYDPFCALVDWLVPGPITPQSIGVHIAMFHTVFNTANTIVMLPLLNQYAALLKKLVKERPGEAELHAVYLPQPMMDTPELSLIHARKEISDMAGIARSMFNRVKSDFESEPVDFEAELEWFQAKENYVDMMNEELSKFLIQITKNDLTERTRNRVGNQLRIITELETMTDECLSIAFILKKKRSKRLVFEKGSFEALKPFSGLVDEFMIFVSDKLSVGMTEIELGKASEMEDKIDAFKKNLKKMSRNRISGGADVKSELLYIDLIRHVEKIGDCAYAVAEELRNFVR
ncbi:MAG: Na/Pi cotransporter family protein [Spirochaetaceae bacterium]|nr:Na/Pi cotransporter family protein [Spirochaetaceae bacterium]